MSYAGTTGAGGGYFIFVLALVVLVSDGAWLISGGALMVSDSALLVSDGALLVSDGAPPDSGLISAGIVCTGHLHQPPPPVAIEHNQIFQHSTTTITIKFSCVAIYAVLWQN